MGVAFLTNLREFEHGVPADEARANWVGLQVPQAVNNKVFAEGAQGNVRSAIFELLDALVGKQTYLAVPRARMRVAFNAVVGDQLGLRHLCFLDSLNAACAYCYDRAHVRSFLSCV